MFKRGAAKIKQHIIPIFAGVLGVMGLVVPMVQEMWSRHKAGAGWLDSGGVLEGAGDMLSVMFLGRNMDGTPDDSSYKYLGWYVVGGSAAILLINKLIKSAAGTVRVWKDWALN
jgi:hypothetical protein